jgi:hypothetical protein
MTVDMKPMMVFACLLFLYFVSPVATNPHPPQDGHEQVPTVLDHNELEQQTGVGQDGGSLMRGHDRHRRNVPLTRSSESGSADESCGANEEFIECGSACPTTCQNMDNLPQICPTVCVQGCFCEDGYVRNEKTGECVFTEQCKGCSTVEGKSCVFPFTYNEKEYYQCTGVDHTMMWCAVKGNGDYNNDDTSWGNCDPSCSGDKPTITTTSGIPCVFPFIYKGKKYNDCTPKDYGTTNWCSVKVDRDDNFITGKWGICSPEEGCVETEEEPIGSNHSTRSSG